MLTNNMMDKETARMMYFALYLGQNVSTPIPLNNGILTGLKSKNMILVSRLVYNDRPYGERTKGYIQYDNRIEVCKLQLKTLSDISDEDAIEALSLISEFDDELIDIANSFGGNKEFVTAIIEEMIENNLTYSENQAISDYLRSKGYYTGEDYLTFDPIKEGWAILIETNKTTWI